MKPIKPGQARALATALKRQRCPKCNRHGSVTADRQLNGCCGHCGSLVTVTAEFTLGATRWTATVQTLTAS